MGIVRQVIGQCDGGLRNRGDGQLRLIRSNGVIQIVHLFVSFSRSTNSLLSRNGSMATTSLQDLHCLRR